MRIIHLSLLRSSASSSHFSMSQKTRAVRKLEKAYTSASTAENQKVSLKVKARAPVKPLPSINTACEGESVLPVCKSLRVRCVMVQNKNRIHPALSNADMMLTICATLEGSLANWVKRLAVSMKKGAPGGWPISSL